MAVMSQSVIQNASNTEPKPAGPLKAVQQKDPMRALGIAVNHLVRQPSFAAQPFGTWSRILIGQINRRHYFFVMREQEIVGFAGWALTSQETAEAWLASNADISGDKAKSGDCMIINAWQANGKDVNAFIVDQLRMISRNLRLVYAKRYYADGRWRSVKLDVKANSE